MRAGGDSMLNINSPTVQAMMNNLPQGVGNMPVYFGNQPQVTTDVQTQQPVQNSTGFSTPYPSPKDMVMQAGIQHQAYYPTSFAPQNNFVGGYNPGIQTAFQNYSNPYMGYGSYMGYGMMGGINPAYMDDMSRAVYYNAVSNGISYDEQLKNDQLLYTSISKIVSKGLGRTEDEAKRAEATFDIVKPEPVQNTIYQVRPHNPMQVVLMRGEEEITPVIKTRVIDPMQNTQVVDSVSRIADMMARENFHKERTFELLHQNAPERMFDDKPFMYFMNNAGGPIYADHIERTLRAYRSNSATALYNANEFRKKLLESNGIKTRSQINAIDRFATRNGIGVLPNGMSISPQHDPSIASSFTYNPATGSYDIQPPGFIKDRLEAARQRFIQTIGREEE